MRFWLALVACLSGVGLIIGGIAMVSIPAAVIVAGVAVLGMAALLIDVGE
jgi:hypothetical protein